MFIPCNNAYNKKQPNLKFKTWTKLLIGSLPFAFALPVPGLWPEIVTNLNLNSASVIDLVCVTPSSPCVAVGRFDLRQCDATFFCVTVAQR